jgi:pimeloyl-ACP methyl ester carboxylesterase
MRVPIHGVVAGFLAYALMCNSAAWANASCDKLPQVDFARTPDAPTQLLSSESYQASPKDIGLAPRSACRIRGYVAPRVQFEIRMPAENWNGKFLYRGCGGFCGSLRQAAECDAQVARGYACIVSDMGHVSGPTDAKWAFNDLQAEFDFAFRATYVTAVIGRELTTRFYGKPIERAYFDGCSTGGRQGLMAAQRFPDLFDGIIIGAPAVSEAGNGMPGLWTLRALRGPDGRSILAPQQVQALHTAVLARCDALDGLADGVLADPRECKFDPAEIRCDTETTESCLTTAQVEAVRKIYAGARDSKGRPLAPGPMRGSERNWVPAYISPDGRLGYFEPFMTDLVRYLSFAEDPGPAAQARDFDFDRDPQRLVSIAQLFYASMNPNLTRARDRGVKIIHYHGYDDASVMPAVSIDYYDLALRTLGGVQSTQQFYRLFMVPGLDHCTGGRGATDIDYLEALESWVEQGVAPAALVAQRREGARLLQERPVFAYPARTRYLRGLDPNKVSAFVAERPKDRAPN